MNTNRICIITGSVRTKETLIAQLNNILKEDFQIVGIALEEEQEEDLFKIIEEKKKSSAFLILSSAQIEKELLEKKLICSEDPICVCERSINPEEIEKVVYIDKGNQVLLANDSEESVEDCIRNLLDFGIDHIKYIPWYPGIKETKQHKKCKISVTIGEIQLIPDYIQEIVDLGPRVIEITSLIRICETIGPRNFYIKHITDYYFSKIISITKKMATLNSETEKIRNILREKLTVKGHLASYTFQDILGISDAIIETKARAMKLSKTDLTVLIEGESGTGKELFASAIHNESLRKNGPYLAVNFSALPEELVESELFGYEEGAFTGAKKGGKLGIFEQADGGTIFLDEIGDISLRIQTKLLRVLQEKEIMPIGGAKIKKVDIRIVAATNKNLKEMVERNEFRGDLYYRLKIGYLYIPPLRVRKEDIKKLVLYFVEQKENMNICVHEDLMLLLEKYNWYGNVRELRNTIQYMLAVRSNANNLIVEDIPDENFFQNRDEDGNLENLNTDQIEVLLCIWEMKKTKSNVGRVNITQTLINEGKPATENKTRKILDELERMGLILKRRGRQGIGVTFEGQRIILMLQKEADGCIWT